MTLTTKRAIVAAVSALLFIVGISTYVLAAPTDAPTGLTADAGDGQVGLTWVAPEVGEGDPAIDGYVVEFSDDGEAWEVGSEVAETSATVDGLDNGVEYSFRVHTTVTSEPEGTVLGAYSDIVTATPMSAIATAPQNLSATAGHGEVSLSWDEPSYTGTNSISDYIVQYRAAGGSEWTIFSDGTSTATSAIVTSLDDATAYDFQVAAFNGANGAFAETSATTFATPGAPTAVSATRGNGQASVSFTAPGSNGGSAITGYTVTSSGGQSATGTSSPITVTGLTNGTAYTFTVVATNIVGNSATSEASDSVTPATNPGTPVGLSASGAVRQVSISWTAPDNGGSDITGYTVEYKLDSETTWSPVSHAGTGTTAVITDLANGATYNFRVAASNAEGTSVFATADATTHSLPGAPTGLTLSPGDASMDLSWAAPSSDGGSPVTGYTVEYRLSSSGTWANSSHSGLGTTATVSGLTNGSTYDFRVSAVTAVGSTASSVESAVPVTTPSAPTGLTLTPGDRQVGLSWDAPSNGGSAITDYIVQYQASGAGEWTTLAGDASIDTERTISGLTNGTSYNFRVAAVNTATDGNAVFTAPASATPRTAPGVPTGLVVTSTNADRNESIALSWTAPSNGGSAITSYTVEYKLASESVWVDAEHESTVTSATITGLTNGLEYDFRVAAANAAGSGDFAASISAIPFTTPSAPTSVSATRGNEQAVVSFTHPTSDGGSTITSYRVVSGGETVATGTSSPITVTGLSNGTAYTFTVVATNAAGEGSVSGASNSVTPATVPGAPTNISVTPSDGQVSVTFAAPADNGGEAVTSYTVTSSPGNFSETSGTLPVVIDGLTNGVAYTFTVVATNDVGAGEAAESDSATPFTIPDAPVNVTAIRGDGSAEVRFDAPAFNGGSNIVDYTVTSSDGQSATGISSPIVVDGLTNGTEYTFTVTARNAAGSSVASDASPGVMPGAVPSAPQNLVATSGDSRVELSWDAPANDGGSDIVNYIIEYKQTSLSAWTIIGGPESTATNATVEDLDNGTSYDFRVSAVNDGFGAGLASSVASAIPATTPTSPVDIEAAAGNGQVALSWSPPAITGGSAVVGYSVQYRSSSSEWSDVSHLGVATTATVTGLTNGTEYHFRVAAINGAGTGDYGAVTATPDLTYPVISDVEVTKSEDNPSEVVISWGTDIPSNSQVEYSLDTSYDNASPVANLPGVTEHQVTITELEECTKYSFRVASASLVDGGRAISEASSFTTLGCPEEVTDDEEGEDTSKPKPSGEDSRPSESAAASTSDQGGDAVVDETDADEGESPDLSLDDGIEAPSEEGDDANPTDAADVTEEEDDDANWTLIGWIIAAVVGIGSAVGIVAARRQSE